MRDWFAYAVQPRYRARLDVMAKTSNTPTRLTTTSIVTLTGVTEYCEGYAVTMVRREDGRLVIVAVNEGGQNSTEVDLRHLVDWLKTNKPELLA